MSTIIGNICSDAAQLLSSEPFNLFLGFAVLGCVVGIIIRLFRMKW